MLQDGAKLTVVAKASPDEIVDAYLQRWDESLTDSDKSRPWGWNDARHSIAWGNCTTAEKSWTIVVAILNKLGEEASPSLLVRQAKRAQRMDRLFFRCVLGHSN